MTKDKKDYIAVILIGAGSSYARGPDRDDCLKRVTRIAFSDWKSLYDLSGKEATANVVDVTGYDKVWWDARGFHVDADPEPELPVEQVKVTFPKVRARA